MDIDPSFRKPSTSPTDIYSAWALAAVVLLMVVILF